MRNLLQIITGMALICLFATCEKMPGRNNNKSLSVPSGLMSDPIVVQMLSELSSMNISVNTHGVLVFQNYDCFNKTLDILQEYDNQLEDEEQYCNDAICCAFEYQHNFNSLRAQIEDELIDLENGDGIDENNDPDDHFIVSHYFRSLLTPQCVVVISNTIYIFYEEYVIGIMNNDWKALDQLLNLTNEDAIATFCIDNPNVFYTDGYDIATCVADFSFTRIPQTLNKFQFTNTSYSNNFPGMSYYWDFGDGTYSTAKDPVHTFAQPFMASQVVLHVYFEGATYSKSKEVKSGCYAEYSAQKKSNGYYKFKSTSLAYDGDAILHYTWTFDNFSSPVTTNKDTISHKYEHNGTYAVLLKITTKGGCTSETFRAIEVDNAECCKANASDKNTFSLTSNTNRKVKSKITASNFGLLGIHWLTAKTVYYKKKNNGKLKREKADKIYAGWNGYIYRASSDLSLECGTPELTNLNKSKKKRKYKIYSESMHGSFKLRKDCLYSFYSIYDNNDGVDNYGFPAKIHQKTCK
jgi:PKD repeat protein